jgi:hypothetical protein
MLKQLVLAVVLTAPASFANAACEPPALPTAAERPVRPERPTRPRCAETGNCPEGVADEFNRQVKAFNAQATAYQQTAQAYVARLNAFVAAAQDYAKCEVTALNAPG